MPLPCLRCMQAADGADAEEQPWLRDMCMFVLSWPAQQPCGASQPAPDQPPSAELPPPAAVSPG